MLRRWCRRSLHDKILIGIARAMLIIMFTCLCMIDSEQWWLFVLVAMLCGSYLAVYTYANRDYRGEII